MEWNKDFSTSYERVYRDVFTDEITDSHANYIARYTPQYGSVLDIPCGSGRVSIALAKKGFFVTGVDLYNIPHAIKNADKFPELKSNLSFETADMRSYVSEKKFDSAVSLFSSFGYFEHDDNIKTLKVLVDAVKEGGIIIIEVRNPVKTFSDMEAFNWEFEIPGSAYNGKSKLNPQTAIQTFTYTVDDKEISADMRHYFLSEYTDLFTAENCTIEEVHGNFKAEPYVPETSHRMIIVARKKDIDNHNNSRYSIQQSL